MRKNRWLNIIILTLTGCFLINLSACQKDQLSTGSGLSIYSSADSLDFDQVFTTEVQPTQSVKLLNGSADQEVRIQHLRLAGGVNSPFKINVNGEPGHDFNALSIPAGDSLYIFVTISLPEHSGDDLFDVMDSIEYQYGDRTDKVILSATGLNAYFLPGGTIKADTTWTHKRPIVLKDNITVAENINLRIEPGTRIYTKAGKGLHINGRLQALGTSDSAGRILMTGSRLDQPYDAMPGSWQGIRFGAQSKNNTLRYVTIQNAVNALTDTARSINGFDVKNAADVLSLEGCIVLQSSREALLFRHTRATLTNCLIYNCGIAMRAMGGHYTLRYLTMAGYSNDLIYHTSPILYLADHNELGENDPLSLSAVNCIITGDNETLDEIQLDNLASAFTLTFNNSLIKTANLPSLGHFTDCQINADPAFASIDNRRAEYDFRLLNVSPAIGAAIPVHEVTHDILGQARSAAAPTIGCYEFKEAATL